MRLDLYLFEKAYTKSRTDAKNLIIGAMVKVNGKVVTKPSFEIYDNALIEVDTTGRRYVSRGGLKLEAALKAFDVDPSYRVCLDVGASSGGFTDCLLKNGAAHVIAVDSGSGQLAEELRLDQRVTVFENYNARYMKLADFSLSPTLAVMDVSFISATYIIPALSEVLSTGSDFICLVKPQFEVGRAFIGKGGVVKDDKAREMAVNKVTEFAKNYGFTALGVIKSPITGGDGNLEYLVHFKVG